MHKRLAGLFVLLCVVVMLGGCAVNPSQPGPGLIYTELSGPHTCSVLDNAMGSKQGTAMATSILGLISTGDCSIQTAAKNGGIKKINHVDYHTKSILGIYTEHTTIVWGN